MILVLFVDVVSWFVLFFVRIVCSCFLVLVFVVLVFNIVFQNSSFLKGNCIQGYITGSPSMLQF